jgi:hypothetical protein
MSKSFIRCVWGDNSVYPEGNLFEKNYKSLKNEYDISLKNTYLKDYVVYVLGENNYKELTNIGFNCVLVNKEPTLFDPIKRIWKHKIYLMQQAMKDFDKIIYLDWDTQPLKMITDSIWDTLSLKDDFQAPLFKYASVKMPHRSKKGFGHRVLPSGAFVYIADKNIPSELLEFENADYLKNKWLDEAYYGAWTDYRYGGWKGLGFYREHFEPECVNIRRGLFDKGENKLFGHPRLKRLKGVK